MSEHLPVILSSKDFALLESLVQQAGESFPGATALIHRKLARATLVSPGDIPADVVTLNSRVRHRIEGHHAEERTLVAGPSEAINGVTLLLNSPHGIALLGAQAAQCIEASRADGTPVQIFIEAVLNPPEQKRARPALTVVSRSELPGSATISNISPLRRPPPPRPAFDGDDPGPSAA